MISVQYVVAMTARREQKATTKKKMVINKLLSKFFSIDSSPSPKRPIFIIIVGCSTHLQCIWVGPGPHVVR